MTSCSLWGESCVFGLTHTTSWAAPPAWDHDLTPPGRRHRKEFFTLKIPSCLTPNSQKLSVPSPLSFPLPSLTIAETWLCRKSNGWRRQTEDSCRVLSRLWLNRTDAHREDRGPVSAADSKGIALPRMMHSRWGKATEADVTGQQREKASLWVPYLPSIGDKLVIPSEAPICSLCAWKPD